jgi:hypothetical protein
MQVWYIVGYCVTQCVYLEYAMYVVNNFTVLLQRRMVMQTMRVLSPLEHALVMFTDLSGLTPFLLQHRSI